VAGWQKCQAATICKLLPSTPFRSLPYPPEQINLAHNPQVLHYPIPRLGLGLCRLPPIVDTPVRRHLILTGSGSAACRRARRTSTPLPSSQNTIAHLMSAEPLYVVVDAGRPMNAFTDKDDLRAFLWRMYRTLKKPLVYRNRRRRRTSDHDCAASARPRTRPLIKVLTPYALAPVEITGWLGAQHGHRPQLGASRKVFHSGSFKSSAPVAKEAS
jgi:hypothetical protein